MSLKRREWMYILSPNEYDCSCDKCGGQNVTWSEWQNMLWCYDCQIDTPGYSIFSGPISCQVAKLLLGDNCFDRLKLDTLAYERFADNCEWVHAYYVQPEFTTA